MTSAQHAANLRSAERIAAISLGVDNQDGSPLNSLTYEQRVPYVLALSKIIADKPDSFSPASVATARLVLAKTYSPLDDPRFDWDAFSSALVDNAVDIGGSVAAVGEGVKNGLNLTRWLIPLALVAVVVLALMGFRKRVGA